MKRFLSLFLGLCLIIVMLAGCSEKTDVPATLDSTLQDEAQTQIAEQEETQEEKIDNSDENKELLEKISVTYEVDSFIQNEKQRMIINIENKSEKVFTGKIYIFFLDKNFNELGADIVLIESLGTGSKTVGNIYITPTQESDIIMTHDFDDEYSFSDDGMSDGILNEELSNALSESMKDSFGNEYYTTSWYPFIKSIEVYSTDDKHYAVVIVTTQEKEIIDSIGNAVFGNSANNSGIYGTEGVRITKVIVKDEAGNTVFTRS